jgi:7-cyano-7-deazaguanine reductase
MLKSINNKTIPLGEKVEYISEYDNSLLFPVKRSFARENMNIDSDLFQGVDIWNCYEVSWLNKSGKPEVRLLRLIYPSESESIVESKSLKLYLNSFNMTKYKNEKEVVSIIKSDLDNLLNTDCEITVFDNAIDAFDNININNAFLIDNLDVDINAYKPDISLLEVEKAVCAEHELYSNLLKTNCPVTGQPDWGTVQVKYVSDNYLLEESLLKYIVSYRNAQDFHEACCEKIFSDIYKTIRPAKLYVKCFYTRRGGVDINPVRAAGYALEEVDFSGKLWRQ